MALTLTGTVRASASGGWYGQAAAGDDLAPGRAVAPTTTIGVTLR